MPRRNRCQDRAPAAAGRLLKKRKSPPSRSRPNPTWAQRLRGSFDCCAAALPSTPRGACQCCRGRRYPSVPKMLPKSQVLTHGFRALETLLANMVLPSTGFQVWISESIPGQSNSTTAAKGGAVLLDPSRFVPCMAAPAAMSLVATRCRSFQRCFALRAECNCFSCNFERTLILWNLERRVLRNPAIS